MTSRLSRLRHDLEGLRATRRRIRQGTAWGALINALAILCLLAFLADWGLDMSRGQRVVLLALLIAAVVWAFRRFTQPLLKQHEDLLEVALLVERKQHIDSDLVAALQFEQPEASQWGSVQLEQAVVSKVAELAPGIKLSEGLPLDEFKRRMTGVAFALAFGILSVAVFPEYITAFFSRMLLADAHYPTKTRITTVSVNGSIALEAGRVMKRIALPISHPVAFEVTAERFIPESGSGHIRVTSLDGSVTTEIPIHRQTANAAPNDGTQAEAPSVVEAHAEKQPLRLIAASDPTIFRGELPRLMDAVIVEVHLGDAISPRMIIDAVPLPIVELHYEVTPPDYARRTDEAGSSAAQQRQLAVVEGSQVGLRLKSLNKPLAAAALKIGDTEFRLSPADATQREWTLNPAGTPLNAISKPVEYRLEVTDDAGLSPEVPLRGVIKLRPDHPPRLTAAVRTRKIIPSAMPPIVWTASDDFGLSKISALLQVVREDGTADESEVVISEKPANKPAEMSLNGTFRLDLTPLKLVKGDELKVTLVATDFRGSLEPRKSLSEPIVLQVTDQQGILSGLLETDQESAKQLDAIIRRELGIGDK